MTDPSVDTLISAVIKAEGGYVNDPNDPGGRTFEGVSARSFPDAWKHGTPTDAEVRSIYQHAFYEQMKINQLPVAIQHQMLDWSINSGRVGIIELQRILKVPADGFIGPSTLTALTGVDLHAINNQLVDARVLMLCRLVQKRPAQLSDLTGLVTRALTFRI